MAEKYIRCPICNSPISLLDGAPLNDVDNEELWEKEGMFRWEDDPILTSIGLAGENYVGLTTVRGLHVNQLQIIKQRQEESAGVNPLTEFERVERGKTVAAAHILQLRKSTEKIQIALGYVKDNGDVDLEYYFNYDELGEELREEEHHQLTWTDPDLTKGTTIRAIHIEELRRQISLGWWEDWKDIEFYGASGPWEFDEHHYYSATLLPFVPGPRPSPFTGDKSPCWNVEYTELDNKPITTPDLRIPRLSQAIPWARTNKNKEAAIWETREGVTGYILHYDTMSWCSPGNLAAGRHWRHLGNYSGRYESIGVAGKPIPGDSKTPIMEVRLLSESYAARGNTTCEQNCGAHSYGDATFGWGYNIHHGGIDEIGLDPTYEYVPPTKDFRRLKINQGSKFYLDLKDVSFNETPQYYYSTKSGGYMSTYSEGDYIHQRAEVYISFNFTFLEKISGEGEDPVYEPPFYLNKFGLLETSGLHYMLWPKDSPNMQLHIPYTQVQPFYYRDILVPGDKIYTIDIYKDLIDMYGETMADKDLYLDMSFSMSFFTNSRAVAATDERRQISASSSSHFNFTCNGFGYKPIPDEEE